MTSSKSALLAAARSQLADAPDDTTAPAPAEKKPAAAKRTTTPKKRAAKPTAKPATSTTKPATPKPAAAKPATPPKAPADGSGLYDRLLTTGDPMRVLYETGHATRGAAFHVLNIQQPLNLRDALDRWVDAEPGRSRKALLNALLAAYLTDTGYLEAAES